MITAATDIVAGAWALRGQYVTSDHDMFMFAIGAASLSTTEEDYAFWGFVADSCATLDE